MATPPTTPATRYDHLKKNQHNAKPAAKRASVYAKLRCTEYELESWKALAEKDGKSLTDFIRAKLPTIKAPK
jgi:flagellar motor switch protein FliG